MAKTNRVGRFAKGDPLAVVRRAHRGYDTFATGLASSIEGKIRCVQRPHRLPVELDQMVRAVLPTELWWPQRDHSAAHRMIDALMDVDVRVLREWKAMWPEHAFGYETFLDWAERRGRAGIGVDPARVAANVPLEKPEPLKLIASVTRHSQFPWRGARATLDVVQFVDGTGNLRVSLSHSSLILSQATIDPMTGRYTITRHLPGRYAACGVEEKAFLQLLGIKTRARLPGRIAPIGSEKTPEPAL